MVVINGKDLTIDEVMRVVDGEEVSIAPESIALLEETRQLVFDLVDDEVPVYGFNVGVGWNKDKAVFKDFFQKYNTNLILSHSIGMGKYSDVDWVRATMLLRVNGFLVGCTGVQVDVAKYYVEFLNKGITPCIPEITSIGMADLGNCAHIGLAMIGEGEVFYKGEIIPASEALKINDLPVINLGPKDGLAIVSSNAYSAGVTVIAINKVRKLLKTANIVFALSLEALDGNTSPFREDTFTHRPYAFNIEMAKEINRHIEGSKIFDYNPNKAVQDPLSFRDVAHVHGAVLSALNYLNDLINVQMNSSDDNPTMLLEQRKILSCANYEPVVWVTAVEMLGQTLTHLSKSSCHRMIKLADPSFTRLERFLSADSNVLGFATLQKTFAALDCEVRFLANPVSSDYYALAGDIEDRGTNASFVARKTIDMIDKINDILAIEAYIACQGISLRLKNDHTLGKNTKKAYETIRESVGFYDADRNVSEDLKKMSNIIKSEVLLTI